MNKKAFIWCFLILSLFVVLVVKKQKSIIKKNNQEIVSFYGEWKTKGKPVIAYKIKKNDIQSVLKTTVVLDSNNTYIGYLPKIYLNTLSCQTPVYLNYKNKKIPCKILEIGSCIQLDYGMYPIKIVCNENLDEKNNKYVVEFPICGLKNVVTLPYDSINIEKNQSFVWIIRDGKAHKQFVTLEEKDYKGVVANGLDEKDLIIIHGAASLKENDLVNFKYEN